MKDMTSVKQSCCIRMVHILNPLAGHGLAKKVKKHMKETDEVYSDPSSEKTSKFIEEACRNSKHDCVSVYGGDGTVYKAVNALMNSGCASNMKLKIVPYGSGNDFVKSLDDKKGDFLIDVMEYNGKYAANVINMGFDCAVVKRAVKLKKIPIVSGKMAYIFGVIGEFVKKKPFHGKITLTYNDGTTEEIEDDFLLAAVANGRWYGGGFQVAPAAKIDDGILDVVIVKNIKRTKFLGMVGDFKKGKHLSDLEMCTVKDKMKEYMLYKKCIGVKVEGCPMVCADGELFEENVVDIKVIPKAIHLIKHEEIDEKKAKKEAKKQAKLAKKKAKKEAKLTKEEN